jgi:uncharacterized protein (TIGR02466 family)
MTVEVHIENIFPIPIYTSKINVDDFDINDVEFTHTGPTNQVSISKDNNLLAQQRYSNLRSRIDEHMHHFYYDVFGYTKQTYPEMVSSWVVRSNPSQESGWHCHGNSIFSGVVYLQTDENCGNIWFRKETLLTGIMQPENEFQTIYNHLFHSIVPSKGLIILFPSFIFHKVSKNDSTVDRYSLAFNYFIKGDFPVRTANLNLR